MFARKLFKLLVAGGLIAGIGVIPVYAGAADDAIKGRQACMKDGNAAMMKALAAMVKGEKPYDAAAVQAAIALDEAACADWDKWWGAETQKGETAETWAKPEVWSDAAGFGAAGDASYDAFVAVKDSTDEASFKAAFPALGKSCTGCHEKFRRPKK